MSHLDYYRLFLLPQSSTPVSPTQATTARIQFSGASQMTPNSLLFLFLCTYFPLPTKLFPSPSIWLIQVTTSENQKFSDPPFP